MSKQVIIINENLGRLDKVVAKEFPDMSRTNIQKNISEGLITINDKVEKASYKTKVGDKLTIEILDDEILDVEPQNIPLDIVYEDEDVIVVNKESGMVVHPSAGVTKDTLVNALLYHCQDLSGINGIIRPGIVHRIDKETSGLLMVAKNDYSHKFLSEQLKDHSVYRRYIALVHGEIPHQFGKIDMPIGRDSNDRKKMAVTKHNSKHAITHFEVLERFNGYTLISCRLETGRTHQIRVHMAKIGYPVYGDPKYGYRKDDISNGQYLHAKDLGFIHPTTNQLMEFTSELPSYMKIMIDKLRGESNEQNT